MHGILVCWALIIRKSRLRVGICDVTPLLYLFTWLFFLAEKKVKVHCSFQASVNCLNAWSAVGSISSCTAFGAAMQAGPGPVRHRNDLCRGTRDIDAQRRSNEDPRPVSTRNQRDIFLSEFYNTLFSVPWLPGINARL